MTWRPNRRITTAAAFGTPLLLALFLRALALPEGFLGTAAGLAAASFLFGIAVNHELDALLPPALWSLILAWVTWWYGWPGEASFLPLYVILGVPIGFASLFGWLAGELLPPDLGGERP